MAMMKLKSFVTIWICLQTSNVLADKCLGRFGCFNKTVSNEMKFLPPSDNTAVFLHFPEKQGGLRKVDDQECTLTLDMKLYMAWQDLRFNIGDSSREIEELDPDLKKEIWTPRLWPSGLKDSKHKTFLTEKSTG